MIYLNSAYPPPLSEGFEDIFHTLVKVCGICLFCLVVEVASEDAEVASKSVEVASKGAKPANKRMKVASKEAEPASKNMNRK
ncbi:hypothetical protein AB3U99_22635 [Niallia sp. JL1B1071]|uniref:hypothetical protein n=1 Tax=Niallia tiangongensis TaxID=3237105 RepID=UPI0037DD078E